MSKLKYEDTFNHLDELVDVLVNIEGSFLYRHYLDNIRLKLKESQKQEKLLELYRVYIRELENMNSIYNAEICEHVKLYHIKDGMLDKYNDTTNKILKEINEIEDEIKGDRKWVK